MQKRVGLPDEQISIKPVPDVWYPADKYVPDTNHPVIVAWRDIYGIEHGGDHTAIYKNGTWRWAVGKYEEIDTLSPVTITDWTMCPDDPDYPYFDSEK